jgi:hypothetical protein
MDMGQMKYLPANPLRPLLVLLLLLLAQLAGNAQTPPVRMSPADSPFPDVSGAQWIKVEGVGRPGLRAARAASVYLQDEAVLKELKDISHERGIPQQVLIAEGLNYVLSKYRSRTIRT